MVFLHLKHVYIVVQPSWEVNELKIRVVLLFVFLLIVAVVFSGCFKGEQTFEEIDLPDETVMYEDDEGLDLDAGHDADANNADEEVSVSETEETVLREIYLIDADGFVVRSE